VRGHDDGVAGKHRKNPHHRGRHRKPPSVAQRALPAGTAVAVIAAGAIVFTQGFADGSTSDGNPRPTASSPAPVEPPPSVLALHLERPSTVHHKVVVHQPKAQHQPRHHPAAYSLLIADTGPDCYVQVTNRHGKLLVRRILHGRQHLHFRQHGLNVVLGNAGAVRVAVNGERFRRAGRSGEVRRFHIH
jgi:hypothetical protein